MHRIILSGIITCIIINSVCPSPLLPTTNDYGIEHYYSLDVIIDSQNFHINFSSSQDLAAASRDFCDSHGLSLHVQQKCPGRIREEMERYLLCEAPLNDDINSNRPRTFRFLRADSLASSKELDIFRTWFLRAGFIECHGSETHYSGREDALWVLGHIKAEASYIFKNLEDYQTINTLPAPLEIGTKDALYHNLLDHSQRISQPLDSFTIRSWDINVLRQTYHHQQDLLLSSSLQGLWILKDPDIEGGYGVEVLNGSQALQLLASNETKGSKSMMLQSYVHAPMLLNGKKFAMGIFVLILSVDPFITMVYDDYNLVLVAAHDFSYNKDDLLAHLTNRARARDVDPDYDADAAWIQMDKFKQLLEEAGHSHEELKTEAYDIITKTMLSSLSIIRRNYFDQRRQGSKAKQFVLWRCDFLFDVTGKGYLLEIELVPATVCMIDEVVRDLYHLVGWSTQEEADDDEQVLLEDMVKARLTKHEDHLAYDEEAISMIVEYEKNMARRGGFLPLIPTTVSSSTTAAAAAYHDYFMQKQAMPNDVILQRWLQLKKKKKKKKEEEEEEEEERNFNNGREAVLQQTPSAVLRNPCLDCISRGATYVAYLSSFIVGTGLQIHLNLSTSYCSSSSSKAAAAAAAVPSFHDAVPLHSIEACQHLEEEEPGEKGDHDVCTFLHRSLIIARSNIIFGGGGSHVDEWCDAITMVKKQRNGTSSSDCGMEMDRVIEYCYQQCLEVAWLPII